MMMPVLDVLIGILHVVARGSSQLVPSRGSISYSLQECDLRLRNNKYTSCLEAAL